MSMTLISSASATSSANSIASRVSALESKTSPLSVANGVNGRKLTSLKVAIRAVNGTYLNPSGGATADEMVGRSGYTTTVAGTYQHPEVTIEKSSAWGNVTNNTPVAVRISSYTLNLT